MNVHKISQRQFLDNLRRSGLLEARAVDSAVAEIPSSSTARETAAALIKAKKLTKFQAEVLLAGKTGGLVLGQYMLLKKLGKGGLGRVYKAVHKTMNRVVAVKVLVPKFVQTDKAKKLFQREVVAAGRLVHPNIATAYDASTSGDHHYLVMEYVDGPNLEQLVRKHGPVRPTIACEIIRQAATAMEYALEMGMLHRDIKPANILIQRGHGKNRNSWVVKIVDFGLARLHTAGGSLAGIGTIMTKENSVMGTPDYLSPEQSRDLHQVDIRSDLYSLGCTFYYLLTGQVPFPGGTSLEKLIRHASVDPVSVSKLKPEIPTEIAQVVGRLMAKDPENRYQTPAELVRALTPFSSSSAAAPLNLQVPADEDDNLPTPTSRPKRKRKTDIISGRTQRSERSAAKTPPSAIVPTPPPGAENDATTRRDEFHLHKGLLVLLGVVFLIVLLVFVLSNL